MEKELIDSLNGWFWGLIAAFGGIGVIVTAIIVFATNLMNHKLIQFWKLSSDKELEALRGIINRNNSVMSSLTQQKGQSFQKLLDKRIHATEAYWERILEMKDSIPSIVFFSYETTFIGKFKNESPPKPSSHISKSLESISLMDLVEKLNNLIKETGKSRPFLSEELWVLIRVYSAFISISTRLLIEEYDVDNFKHWEFNRHAKHTLRIILSEEEFNYIVDRGPHAYKSAFDILENKILQEIKKITSSEELTTDSLSELKRINLILESEG